MIGGAKGIGIGIDFGIPNQYCRATSKPYIEKDVLDSLRVVASAYGKSNDDADRSIVKNLVDASNPFIISNAAFKLNSGFGKYETELSDTRIWTKSKDVTSSPFSSSYNGLSGWIIFANTELTNSVDIPSIKIEVKGLLEGQELIYRYYDSTGQTNVYSMTKDGEYTLPADVRTAKPLTSNTSGFQIVKNETNTITITQIPSFEGAFVTDGIDDLIKSTKSATEMLDGSNEVTVVSMIHQIKTNSDTTRNNWFFTPVSYLENRVVENKTGKTGIYGYTSTNVTNAQISDITPILGDKNDYTLYSKIEDGDRDYFTVEGFQNQRIWYVSSIAWYWTIIANKVLTTDQINQVIAYFNLDRTLKPDILCDVKKQGITNENHAEFGDKLIDFSGNGRDIQLNNIAWKGDSGIGKYEVDFLDSSIWNSSNSTITSSKIDCKNAISHIMLLYYSVGSKEYPDIPSFKVIKTGADIDYSYIDETGSPKSVKIVDGVNILPASHNTLYSGSGRFCGFGNPGMGNSVTITQIPSHAGALCLDGVNDFGQFVGDLGLKDYTFIMDREYLSLKADQVPVISSINPSTDTPFIFEHCVYENRVARPFSFGKDTVFEEQLVSKRFISYQSTYKYNGKDILKGTSVNTGSGLTIGRYGDDRQYANFALYFLMLFPYSMSEFLIERQLKKHKLGTLYPNMVEFRPVIKANANYKITYYQIDSTNTWKSIKVGDYIVIGAKLAFQITFDNDASELKEVVSPQLSGIIVEKRPSNPGYNIYSYITSKSPQKINITIDEYIRYEDIVQPYPVLLRFNDENGNEVSWGGKFRVGSTITRIGSIADPESNLLNGLYSVSGLSLNGKAVTSSTSIVEKQMVFKTTTTYLLDNNEPKCILSPSRLRIPNSSYKLLGYIPDISGHGNHGVIHNSAYAEGSGVNEDGSYQLDGVDDFVTIPTLSSGGKQVLMKVNWQSSIAQAMLYDQRGTAFAIWNSDKFNDDEVDTTPAYSARNGGNTYIDGILNKNILASQLRNITHNIVATNNMVNGNSVSPSIGCTLSNSYYSQMALYDFMLFDEISTDDKIKELNEYVGIEAKVELPPYYWDNYGKTNLDADKATIQQRGVAVGDYDITNYNHAYDKMSGYGGYNLGRFDKSWASSSSSNTSIKVVQRNPYDITLKKLGGNSDWEFNTTELKIISNPVSVKFKSDKNIRFTCDYHYYPVGENSEGTPLGITSKDLIANEDTVITISPISQENIDKYNIDINRGYYLVYFQLSSTLAVNEEVTIEMLPLYPNGLVYDGVTDYSENSNIPAFTDYTYILKRKILKGIANSAVMYKGNITVNQGGAFICNYCEPSDTNLFTDFSFGGLLRSNDINKPIIYGTKTSVNGNSITPGEKIDTVGINVGKWVNYLPMVFYKLVLYPKTIPLLQINFLKNLMERDEIIDLNNKIFIQE